MGGSGNRPTINLKTMKITTAEKRFVIILFWVILLVGCIDAFGGTKVHILICISLFFIGIILLLLADLYEIEKENFRLHAKTDKQDVEMGQMERRVEQYKKSNDALWNNYNQVVSEKSGLVKQLKRLETGVRHDDIKVLERIAERYSGKTLDNVIIQLKAIEKEHARNKI